MFKQMSQYFDPFFSKFQCGFREGFNVQQCLLSMLETWKLADDVQKKLGHSLQIFPRHLIASQMTS